MDLSHLTDLAIRYSSENTEDFQSLPGLSIFRRDMASDIEAFIYEPVLCLILQGSKTTSTGDQRVELKPGDALLVSHDLPVIARITGASVREPYLAIILSIDLGLVRSLHNQIADALEPDADVQTRSLSAGLAEAAWLAPLIRYFGLMASPL